MRTLLIEPFGGLAGDMLLAALLDLERPELGLADLRAFVARLVPGACRLELGEVTRQGLRAKHLAVETDESHHAPHRHLSDLLALVAESGLSGRARERSEAALLAIARAEATVHATSIDEVHFHEIGAVDTLVDVCGAAFALERLGVEALAARPPYAGGGTVRCEHGELPVPAPGTAALLGARAWIPGVGGERLTPTGAALYATWTHEIGEGTALRALARGYGAGTRDPQEGPPNLVRVQLCEAELERGAAGADEVVLLLELNLDDATGEEVGFLVGALRAAGALEAWTQPAQMKKDRPGVIVSALCARETRPALEAVAFLHSPTLGVRWSERQRSTCARETLSVELHGRPVRVKLRRRPGAGAVERIDLSPEHDDLAALAERTGEPLRALEARAIELALARAAGAL
jgi:uncharacterized protein (TIGR00299 family) protein